MKAQNLFCWLLLGLSLAGCGTTVDQPYETCSYGNACSGGTDCLQTTLPAAVDFTGYLCTTTCYQDADCPQDLSNYAAICANSQCYVQCPTGGENCPYGTGCLQFFDENGYPANLCTP